MEILNYDLNDGSDSIWNSERGVLNNLGNLFVNTIGGVVGGVSGGVVGGPVGAAAGAAAGFSGANQLYDFAESKMTGSREGDALLDYGATAAGLAGLAGGAFLGGGSAAAAGGAAAGAAGGGTSGAAAGAAMAPWQKAAAAGSLLAGGAAAIGAGTNMINSGEAGERFDRAMEQQAGNLQFMQDLLRDEVDYLTDERKYLRSQQALNETIAQNERQQAFNIYFENNAQLQRERDYFVQRQEFVDKQAAAERAEQLGFMLENKMIAEQEREFALQELYRAQQIAQGERDAEMRQFYDNQYRAEAERQYSVEQYERAQGIAADERAEETRIRDALDGQLTMFQDELRRVQEGLGDIRRLDPLTQDEIDTQVGRYRSVAQDSYNEVIEQMASMNEADLRRRGIAATDPGDTRSRMAQRLADDLAATQMQAEQQALAYISGERGLLFDDIQQDIATRNAILGETANVGLAGFDQRRNLMNTLPTANVAAPVPIGSSVLQQRFSSANVAPPVAINSAQYSGSLPSGIGQQLSMPSAVQGNFSPPSAMIGASSSPNLASGLMDSVQRGYGDMAENYGAQTDYYGQQASQNFAELANIFEDYMAGQAGREVTPTGTIPSTRGSYSYGVRT